MAGSSQLLNLSLLANDFEELQDAAAGWDQQYQQMATGHYEGGSTWRPSDPCRSLGEICGRKTRYRGTAPSSGFGFALRLDGPGTANWISRPACADTVVVQAPVMEADMVSPKFWDALVLGLAEDDVLSVASALSQDVGLSSEFHATIALDHEVAEKVRRTGRSFIELAMNATPEDEPHFSKLSEQFSRLFIWELVDAQAHASLVVRPSRPAQIVKRAAELVLSDPTRTVGLTEICADLDVSLRTPHYAFQDVLGMSPATWLRQIRRNLIHKMLQKSSRDAVQVKAVAIEHGSYTLGISVSSLATCLAVRRPKCSSAHR